MSVRLTPERLREALALELPYAFRGLPLWGRRSAVIAVVAPSPSGEASPALLLTQRAERLEKHRGQIAFPGGAHDASDDAQGGLVFTALREAEEEVGLPRTEVEILGSLPELATPTGYRITPFVAWARQDFAALRLAPNPEEIAEAFWVPFGELLDPKNYCREPVLGRLFETDAFYVQGKRVWGATGAMVKNLLDRLERLG